MYEDYFGLERPPFKITPDTSLFFEGGKRGDILAALVYAIHRGEGIIKVVGEVGSGKTMLCRMLQLKVPDTVEIVYIANPSVSPDDILFVIGHELELPIERDASKHEVMRLLQDYLLQRHMENKQVVLFVEEAQGMPLDTLEEIRLLSNLETAEHKLMQIILFGQPELDENLSQQSIRQLRERITHNFELEPLTQEEIHSYLNFRMRQVGYTGPELISNNVARKIEVHSEGLLRRINIIADKILLSAFAEGTHNLSAKHVSAAVNDSAFNQEAPRKSNALWWIILLAVVALAFALYQTRTQWMATAGIPIQPAAQTSLTSEAGEQEPVQTPDTEIEATLPTTENGVVKVEAETATSAAEPVVESSDASSVDSQVVVVDSASAQSQDEDLATQVDQLTTQIDDVLQDVQDAVQEEEAATEVSPDMQVATLSGEDSSVVSSAAAEPDEASELVVPSTGENVVVQEKPVLETATTEVAGNTTNDAPESNSDYRQWLGNKLAASRDWLSSSERRKLSIQVMMRKTTAARELVYYLRNEWPLDISQTYLYEVNIEGRSIYRVFYSEFDSVNQARSEIDQLPDSVKVNSPYVHSVSRMRRALL